MKHRPGAIPVPANPSSPLHFRPARGRICDTIPFFHDGEYHIFYIRCDAEGGLPWDHIVSRDLVHWHELPTALERDPNDPLGPDGRDMFTGCVVEHDGVFHIFYTGHNPKNPDGAEIICHATSTDLVTWHKHREHCFGPDGAVYHPRDFRDPFVFRHEESGEWWMLLCAGLAGSDFSGIGRLVSTDLVSWKPAEPLILDPPLLEGETGAPECPDLFRIGDYWHLLYTRRGQNIRRARHVEGPFTHGVPSQLDDTLLLAGKRLFDGRRHVYFGPLSGDHDDSVMNLPRELFQGDDGHLRVRPVREVVDSFVDVVHESAAGGFDLSGNRLSLPGARGLPGALLGRARRGRCPDHRPARRHRRQRRRPPHDPRRPPLAGARPVPPELGRCRAAGHHVADLRARHGHRVLSRRSPCHGRAHLRTKRRLPVDRQPRRRGPHARA